MIYKMKRFCVFFALHNVQESLKSRGIEGHCFFPSNLS